MSRTEEHQRDRTPTNDERHPAAREDDGPVEVARDALRRARRPARIHLAGDLLEQFFVSAVVAVLGIRVYLELTNYPQVGGDTLHIAHMLWGGLGMLIALVLALTFLGRRVRSWVAIIGGLGFGTFIDELGKFITADNDYFYRPAWIVIYIIFILMFFTFTALTRRQHPNGRPALASAADLVVDASLYGLRPNDREVILRLLDDADEDNPLTPALRDAVERLPIADDEDPSLLRRGQDWLRDRYRRLTQARRFRTLMILVFVAFTASGIAEVIVSIVSDPEFSTDDTPLGPIEWIQIVAAGTAAALAVLGVISLARSRLRAYRWFRVAILVSLLIGQPLAFFDEAVFATGGLLIDLIALGAFNYGISVEVADREAREPSEDDHTPGFLGIPI